MGVGLGLKEGELLPATWSLVLATPTRAPPLPQQFGQDDNSSPLNTPSLHSLFPQYRGNTITPAQTPAYSPLKRATAHTQGPWRLVYTPTSPSRVVFSLHPLGAEPREGIGRKGTRAGSAGFRTGLLPAGVRTTAIYSLPAPVKGEGAANRVKRGGGACHLAEMEGEPKLRL